MNKAQRILLSAKHARRMKLFERQFLRLVYEALQSQIKPVVEKLNQDGPQAAMSAVHNIVINEKVGEVILNLYYVVGVYFGNQTLRDLRVEEKGFGYNEEFIRAIINYFSSYLLDKSVTPITQTTKEQILKVLSEGIEKGWSVDKMAMMLVSSELTLWRARMIVRTESNRAMNYGQQQGESKSRHEVTKTWIAANDHRTRHSHRVVDDETIDFNKYFHVPIMVKGVQVGEDLMEGPGDIHATAGNVINCRCRLTFKGKRDEQGKLVVKQGIYLTLPGIRILI